MKWKRTAKRLLALGTAAAVAASMAACGSGAGSPAASASAAGLYQPGTYTASEMGMLGDVTVTLTVDADRITDVQIEGNETEGIGSKAIDELPAAILEAQSAQVDAIAGATITSNAIRAAVENCLAQAKGESAAAAPIAYTPGTYTASAIGRDDYVTVEVTFSEDRIEAVNVVEQHETAGVSDLPLAKIPADIVEYQSLGVDVVSGASVTSRAILTAVADAVEQAGGNTAALRQVEVPHEAQATEDITTQIVVVGGGMAGLTAASVAANEGAEVVLVEKLPFVGGSLLLAGGSMVTTESEECTEDLADDNLADTLDFVRSINEDGSRQPDYEYLEYVLSQTGPTMDYFIREYGWEPYFQDRTTYVTTRFGVGYEIVQKLEDVLEQNDVQILLNTAASEILMENGEAKGVRVSNQDGTFNIYADKVIVAAGGTSWDREAVFAANPELEVTGLSEQATIGNDGSGYRMLEAAGAQMGSGPYVKSATPDFSLDFRFTWANNPSVANQLVVNAEGERFANESPYSGMIFNSYLMDEGSSDYFVLYDTVNTDETLKGLFDERIDRNDRNIVVYADTIEELAGKLGIDPAALQASFDRYQSFCESGVDEDYGKAASHLVPYAEGGYYAAKITPASWGSYGGALTDENFHALDANGAAIPNLYAAGECATSELFGEYYIGGFSLGLYSTAGRLAAQSAVAELAD